MDPSQAYAAAYGAAAANGTAGQPPGSAAHVNPFGDLFAAKQEPSDASANGAGQYGYYGSGAQPPAEQQQGYGAALGGGGAAALAGYAGLDQSMLEAAAGNPALLVQLVMQRRQQNLAQGSVAGGQAPTYAGAYGALQPQVWPRRGLAALHTARVCSMALHIGHLQAVARRKAGWIAKSALQRSCRPFRDWRKRAVAICHLLHSTIARPLDGCCLRDPANGSALHHTA